MSRRLSFLAAFILAALVVSVTAWAQYLGTSSVSGGGGGLLSASAVMDAIQTIDGAASQLDADFLDGISSQGFCQVTGGADCTLTGAPVTDGSPDIKSVTNEPLELQGQGTGTVKLWPEGVTSGLEAIKAGASRFLLRSEAGSAAVYFGVGGEQVIAGPSTDRAASELAFCAGDTITPSTLQSLKCSTAGGMTTSNLPQTCDCGTAGTPNTVTCDITSDVVYLIDGDADACTVTLSETTAAALNLDIGPVTVIVASLGGGGSFTIADSPGVVELAGGTSFTGDSVGDVLTLQYLAYSTVDTWLEIARANN